MVKVLQQNLLQDLSVAYGNQEPMVSELKVQNHSTKHKDKPKKRKIKKPD